MMRKRVCDACLGVGCGGLSGGDGKVLRGREGKEVRGSRVVRKW
jgi:hypothetical protein